MRELSKVKTQADAQQSGKTKSAPVGGSLDVRLVFGAEEKANPFGGPRDVLFRITILLRAHAVAGVISVGDATDQSQPEEDSTPRSCECARTTSSSSSSVVSSAV